MRSSWLRMAKASAKFKMIGSNELVVDCRTKRNGFPRPREEANRNAGRHCGRLFSGRGPIFRQHRTCRDAFLAVKVSKYLLVYYATARARPPETTPRNRDETIFGTRF